jgi:putative (di)nucleoside polyphosphate hydrolase
MNATLSYRPCVGIMVLNAQHRIWIGRRVGAPQEPEGPGTWWQMPQGGIDAEENAEDAARRELFEETGMRSVTLIAESPGWYSYDLPEALRPRAWGGRYRGQRQKWFAMRFLGPEAEIAIERPPGQDREFDAWRWAEASELVSQVVPFKRAVYAQVLRDFAGLLADPA